jgi:hypothetical protein
MFASTMEIAEFVRGRAAADDSQAPAAPVAPIVEIDPTKRNIKDD